jgi:general nucleoside transport system permease protein
VSSVGADLGAQATLRRSLGARKPEWLWSAGALVLSLVIVGPLIALASADPLDGYSTLFSASFGSLSGFGTWLQYSVPLILVGLGVALPLRVGLFNIGGEGQLLLGAFAAVVVGVKLGGAADLPGSFLIPLVAAAIGGALLGGIAGALKAWRGVNEIITTIMLNFVAALFVQYWVDGPFKDPLLTYNSSPQIEPGYGLVHLGTEAQIPTSIFVALAVAGIVGCAVHFTRAGWRMHVAGANPELAARRGISVPRIYLYAMLFGGALAGLGGGAEVVGNQLRVGDNFSPGWGFDAIAIAVLARGNMIAVVPFALLYGFLRNGAGVLETNLGVPGSLVEVLAGAPIIIVAAVIGYRSYRQSIRAV